MEQKFIIRTTYLEKIKAVMGTPDIKVITGVRRAGKSELLKSFIQFLKESEPKSNIIYVDLMDLENEPLKEYHALYTFVMGRYQEGVKNYVMVDEVSLCENFELAINSLYNKKKFDIYITGSNAFLLSSDLTTLFTGRFFEIHVFPFSFKEYLSYTEDEDIDRAFDNYVLTGRMSGSYLYPIESDRAKYIQGIFNTIIARDIKAKYHLPDDTALFKTADFLLDNISNLTSVNRISDILNANQIPTNHNTIGNYAEYLCQAYLFYKIQRYDLKGKGILKTLEKYYEVDPAFRYARLGKRNMDYGRQYENLVALELLRRGYSIYVGKLYQKEVDFVIMDQEKRIYIQVSDDISSVETLAREKKPLLAIKDAYPKVILARTRHLKYDSDGIEILDLARWLSGTEKTFF